MATVVQISDNAAAVTAQLRGFPPAMQQKIAAAMDLQNQLTIGHSQANYLSGPRPGKLGVVTNRLRGSINAKPARATERTVQSTIGTNVEYAMAHEKGFDGPVTVRKHSRKYEGASVFMVQTGTHKAITEVSGAKGRYSRHDHLSKRKVLVAEQKIFEMRTGRILAGDQKAKKVAQGFVTVREHTRQMHLPVRPFLAPAIEDRKADYGTAVSDAILRAWNGENIR
jgi:phage gpG-like protein